MIDAPGVPAPARQGPAHDYEALWLGSGDARTRDGARAFALPA